MSLPYGTLIPAKAGTQAEPQAWPRANDIPHAQWVPAFVGTSGEY